MGCISGKVKQITPDEGHGPQGNAGEREHLTDHNGHSGNNINWEQWAIDTHMLNLSNMREDMRTNPELLLLNLIMMSVQFLKNFERDKGESITQREADKRKYDDTLVEQKKHCLLPTSLFSKVQDYVSYEENSPTLEQLVATDCMLCYDNIETYGTEEIERLQDSSEVYIHLDNPVYRAVVESSKNQGYVKVRCVDDPSKFQGIKEESDSDALSEFDNQEEDEPDTTKNKSHIDDLKYKEPINTFSLVVPPGSASLMTTIPEFRDSFDPIVEDGPNEDFMSILRDRVESDNYLKFGPSEREAGKGQNSTYKLQGSRRGSDTSMPSALIEHKRLFQKKKMEPEKEKKPQAAPFLNNVDEDEYAYVTNRAIPLKQFEERTASTFSIISDNCFQMKDVPIVEDDENDPYPIQAEMEKRCYLSSKRFMFFFANQFYEIARCMGKSSLTSSAKILPPKMLCREEIEGTYKELKWHFMPTVQMSFMPDSSIEFFYRKRTVMRDIRTNISYQWPDNAQVQAVRQLGCNIVPVGFIHPRKEFSNEDSELEWEVYFTKAEMYLTKNLHHPKVRAFMFTLLMFRTYFESFEGLEAKHLRHIFYWMVEKSPADWTEENLGEKFLLILKSLKAHLVKQRLPNFFIGKANMFANIPNHKLRQAQERIHRIKEKPVLYLLNSLLKLQFEKNFYPRLDIGELYKLLTTDDQLAMRNPHLMGVIGGEDRASDRHQNQHQRTETGDRYQEHMRKEARSREQEAKNSKVENDREKPIVDLEANLKPFDEARMTLVLEFFTEHFLKMAEKSNVFRNQGQSYMYLMQAENLVTILKEDYNLDGSPSVSQFSHRIMKLKDSVNYSLYIQDYWAISFGHKMTSGPQMRSEQDLPPEPVVISSKKSKKKSDNSHQVNVVVHQKRETSKRNGLKFQIENFDASESSDNITDFDYSEFTRL